MKLLHAILPVLSIMAAQPALAHVYSLHEDLGTENNQHLCRYTNNQVYAYDVDEDCPAQIEDGQSTQYSTTQWGYKVDEYQDSMGKMCVYMVMGQRVGLRLNFGALCPQTYQFDN